MTISKIVASGSYLPSKIVTNFELEKSIDTTNQWIIERTGIEKRHIAATNQLTSDLALEACRSLFNSYDYNIEDVEMIVLATTTPDLTFPATATSLQAKLGAKKAFAFDVQAVCSGFVYALNIADNFIKTGQVKNALVVGAETLSRIVEWQDRNSCVLFGDGAGAILLEANNSNDQRGIISCNLNSDGNLNDILKTNGGVSYNQTTGFIEMLGKEVFRHAVEKMTSSILTALKNANLAISDINLLIPHQANIRILDGVAKKLNLSPEQVIITVDKHANTSAASIPLALDYAWKKGKIKDNDIVVFEALGGGLTWGSSIVRF